MAFYPSTAANNPTNTGPDKIWIILLVLLSDVKRKAATLPFVPQPLLQSNRNPAAANKIDNVG